MYLPAFASYSSHCKRWLFPWRALTDWSLLWRQILLAVWDVDESSQRMRPPPPPALPTLRNKVPLTSLVYSKNVCYVCPHSACRRWTESMALPFFTRIVQVHCLFFFLSWWQVFVLFLTLPSYGWLILSLLLMTSFQQFRLFNVGCQNDVWIVNWKGCERKRSWANLQWIPVLSWRGVGKLLKNSH
jgi:hypothetical protein